MIDFMSFFPVLELIILPSLAFPPSATASDYKALSEGQMLPHSCLLHSASVTHSRKLHIEPVQLERIRCYLIFGLHYLIISI